MICGMQMRRSQKCWKLVKMTRERYTDENIEYIRKIAKIKNITEVELNQKYNKKFNQNRSIASLKYIRTKNEILLNNNRSRAGAGQNRRGSKPIGTERVRKDYVEIKVEQPNIWDQKQRYLWEQHHKMKLKHNEVVIFLDKNNRNFDIDNLAMIPRSLLGVMNTNSWISENPELTKSGVQLAKLVRKIYAKEQEK